MLSMATINALKTDLCFRHDLSAYQQCLQHQVLREMEQEVMRNEQFKSNVGSDNVKSGRKLF